MTEEGKRYYEELTGEEVKEKEVYWIEEEIGWKGGFRIYSVVAGEREEIEDGVFMYSSDDVDDPWWGAKGKGLDYDTVRQEILAEVAKYSGRVVDYAAYLKDVNCK